MSCEITSIELLRMKDLEQYGRLLHIGEKAKALLNYTQAQFPYYTPHGFDHSLTIQENLDWIVPDKVKESFNSTEIFLFSMRLSFETAYSYDDHRSVFDNADQANYDYFWNVDYANGKSIQPDESTDDNGYLTTPGD